jgi:hypothetical protein
MWLGLISPASVIGFGYIASFFRKPETVDLTSHVVWGALKRRLSGNK